MQNSYQKGMSKRSMTSAIPGMSVADVRKCLSAVRQCWKTHSPTRPMRVSECLQSVEGDHGMTVEQFALLFVLGHHDKRHKKAQAHKSEEDS